MTTPAEKVTADLARVSAEIAANEAAGRKLKQQRLRLWRRGRRLRIPHTILAEASTVPGVRFTPGHIRQSLYRAEHKEQ